MNSNMYKQSGIKHTKDTINQKLKDLNKPFQIIGEYINNKTITIFECINKCGETIQATVQSFDRINNYNHCNKCTPKRDKPQPITMPNNKNNLPKLFKTQLMIEILNWQDYKNSHTNNIQFKCLKNIEHNLWQTSIHSILQGTRCPACSNLQRYTEEQVNIILASKNIKLLQPFDGAIIHITNIQCTICSYGQNNEWTTPLAPILYNTGCPKCNNHLPKTIDEINTLLQILNIKQIQPHNKMSDRVEYYCYNCNNPFITQPKEIVAGQGCPYCNKYICIIATLLNQYDISFIRECRLQTIASCERNLKADFFLPKYNTIIEYNGDQHYQPVCFGGITKEIAKQKFIDQQARDYMKQQWCDTNNIKLIWIDGRSYVGIKLEQHTIEIISSILSVFAA